MSERRSEKSGLNPTRQLYVKNIYAILTSYFKQSFQLCTNGEEEESNKKGSNKKSCNHIGTDNYKKRNRKINLAI